MDFKIILGIILITALFILLLFWNKNILIALLLFGIIFGGIFMVLWKASKQV